MLFLKALIQQRIIKCVHRLNQLRRRLSMLKSPDFFNSLHQLFLTFPAAVQISAHQRNLQSAHQTFTHALERKFKHILKRFFAQGNDARPLLRCLLIDSRVHTQLRQLRQRLLLCAAVYLFHKVHAKFIFIKKAGKCPLLYSIIKANIL